MARVKVMIPSHKPFFVTNIRIRISDINYGNHMANDAVLSLAHEVRLRALNHYGLSEMNIGEGVSIIMADAAIQFLHEGFYGDVLTVSCYIDDVTQKSFDMIFHFQNAEEQDIAKVKTGIVAFNYEQRRVMPLPTSFIQLIS